ncbi:VWA domain-containing protein [Planotetraspora sp. A-T 1434]|nr:VWA domain-containing protein [Planotetraspora sp. A-T 1434]
MVLDRSGSMRGGKLAGAQRALLSLVDRLDPVDQFGLVSFDDTARIEVPNVRLSDKDAARLAIAALRPGSATDLSSGLLRGIQEARRASADQGASLLLISDGHANQGILEHQALAQIARDARAHNVSVTTLGYGLGYDEDLLGAIADGGGGSALHAGDPDAAGQFIAAEVTGLLTKTAQAASLAIRPRGPVSSVSVYGRLPSATLDDATVVELTDFYAGETRKLLLRLAVPGIATLGLATVADLVFTYVETATLTTYTVTVPINVNVVPGDEAAGRVPDTTVEAERLFQEAQEGKRTAVDLLAEGDIHEAARVLGMSASALRRAARRLPERSKEFDDEAADLDYYSGMSQVDVGRARKEAYRSWSSRTRTSGRPNQPAAPSVDDTDDGLNED